MIGLLLLVAIAGAVDAPASATSGIEVQVSTVDGRLVAGQLEQVSKEQLKLTTATLPMDEVLMMIPTSAPVTSTEKPTTWIELIDGSKFTATDFAVEGGKVNLFLGGGRTATGTIATLNKVRFSAPGESLAWPENVTSAPTVDLLAVRKNDKVDFLEGAPGNVDDNFVILKADGEKYPVKRSKVDGLVYFHKAADEFPAPLCVVQTSGGWKLKVKELSYVPPSGPNPDGRFEVTTLSGDSFLFISGNEITKLDFSAGKIGYLSDLEPVSVQWTPYLDLGDSVPAMAEFYAPRRDEGREHQPLRLAGKEYGKGMSLYPRTAIEYRVPSGMKKFKAAAGIDDAVRETGNARLAISADGKMLFDRTIRGKDVPADLDLDISGAKRLSILVDFGDQFDAGDFLDLGDARMVK